MSQPTNYQICVTQFGAYRQGNVVPAYELGGHDIKFLLERGIVVATAQPPNVELAPKKAAPEGPPEDIVAERNRLFTENGVLKKERDDAIAAGQEIAGQRDALRQQIAGYAERNGALEVSVSQLEAELAAARDENKKLAADLDAATAPAKS